MTDYQRSLASFYKGWDGHQQRLAEAIAPLTREQLALSLPHHWSVGKIVAHIIAARVWWMCLRAGEGSPHLAPLEHWDASGAPLREARELVRGLEQTWEVIDNVLAQWTPTDLEQVLPALPGDPVERTRQWIIWHLVEHDVFHGGEISAILGAHGLPVVVLE